MTTTPPMPERHYLVLGIIQNDNGDFLMEVLFHEDGHALRYNLWLPDDPAKVDAAVKLSWPLADFATKKAAASNIQVKLGQFKALIGSKTSVSGEVGPPPAPPAPPAPPVSPISGGEVLK